MNVSIHQYRQSKALEYVDVVNTYQKGNLFCVLLADGTVYKHPIQHIFRIKETASK